jgi:hypothetical protein
LPGGCFLLLPLPLSLPMSLFFARAIFCCYFIFFIFYYYNSFSFPPGFGNMSIRLVDDHFWNFESRKRGPLLFLRRSTAPAEGGTNVATVRSLSVMHTRLAGFPTGKMSPSIIGTENVVPWKHSFGMQGQNVDSIVGVHSIVLCWVGGIA